MSLTCAVCDERTEERRRRRGGGVGADVPINKKKWSSWQQPVAYRMAYSGSSSDVADRKVRRGSIKKAKNDDANDSIMICIMARLLNYTSALYVLPPCCMLANGWWIGHEELIDCCCVLLASSFFFTLFSSFLCSALLKRHSSIE